MAKWLSKNKKLILMIAFTAFALLVWRFGTKITIPLFDVTQGSLDGNLFGFLDIFTGSALSQFSILALGISPYITSSIVVQLLQMDIIPQFKEWAEEGEAGRAKLNQWTRYIALLLAFVQSVTIIVGLNNSGGTMYFEVTDMNAFSYLYMALVMTAGTAFVMWLADQITMHGIGNGGSMLIVAGIISSFPSMFTELWKTFIAIEERTSWDIIKFIIVAIMFVLIIVAVVWFEGIQRKIPVQYANRPGYAKLSGRQDSSIPIKLNSASVIPVIFASTILSIPLTILNFVRNGQTVTGTDWWTIIFSTNEPIGFVIYILLIFVFSFFYSFLQIDPDKMAENLKKQNAYIPTCKPGEETADFISRVLFKVTLLGATYLAILAALPIIFTWAFGLPASVSVGGTSIMIVVGVAIETAKQIKQESESQEYHGFL
jgi:preprotein translocase subunit SecY